MYATVRYSLQVTCGNWEGVGGRGYGGRRAESSHEAPADADEYTLIKCTTIVRYIYASCYLRVIDRV